MEVEMKDAAVFKSTCLVPSQCCSARYFIWINKLMPASTVFQPYFLCWLVEC